MLFCFLVLGRCGCVLLRPLNPKLVRAEHSHNDAIHRELVAKSDSVWRPPFVARQDDDQHIVSVQDDILSLTNVLSESERLDLIRESRLALSSSSQSSFTMSGKNVREVHVSQLSNALEWTRRALLPRLSQVCSAFGVVDFVPYDALVLYYDAEYSKKHGMRADQPAHRDHSDFTVNVALNGEFEGGGTRFEHPPRLLVKRNGDGIAHAGATRHSARASTSGERWVLVIFFLDRLRVNHSLFFHERSQKERLKGRPGMALRLARCHRGEDPELMVQASAASSQIADAINETARGRFSALSLLYASRAVRKLPNSVAALHAFGQARLRTATSRCRAAEAANIFLKALDHYPTPEQEKAICFYLDLARKTEDYLLLLRRSPSPSSDAYK